LGSPALRVIHSFPTRRSSDLPVLGRAQDSARGASIPVDRDDRVDQMLEHFRSGQAPVFRDVADEKDGHAPLLGVPDETRRRLAEDRKSTRLNSSHRTISYAVF